MKRILLIIGALMLLVACGEDKLPDLEDRIQIEESISYTGVIESVPIDLYRDGTHQIITSNDAIIIQSPKINLSQYEGKEVTITGSVQKLVSNIEPIFTVEAVEVGDIDLSLKEFESRSFGLSLQYPNSWELNELPSQLIFSSGSNDWLLIDAITTDLNLAEYFEENEIEEGTAITVAGQRSNRIIRPEAVTIYVPNPARDRIYRIIFNDALDGSDEQKAHFFALVESTKLTAQTQRSGEKCGGKEALTCPEDFRCELDSAEEDAEGVCIAVDNENGPSDCPFVPTPANCLHYEVKSTNRDGCPTSYICLEEADESFSPSASVEDVVEDNIVEVVSPVDSFQSHHAAILPADAEVTQYEWFESDELLAVVYQLEEESFRTMYTYSPSANEFNFNKVTHYQSGEDRDWEVVEGSEQYPKGEKTVIRPSNGDADVQVIRSDMRLYENTHRNFSVQYPKNWFYRSFGPIENTVWTVGFAEGEMDEIFDADITLVIDDEAGSGKASIQGDRYIVEVNRDEDSHFILDGPLEMKEDLDFMASSIR